MGHARVNIADLQDIACQLVNNGKGILAMDESNGTCDKRFVSAGIPAAPDARRLWRDLILTTPSLGACISGVILYDETIHQTRADGTPFLKILGAAGILPGIKVDAGIKDLALFPRETITEGLDGLRGRLNHYREMGARFAKWRAVMTIADDLPSWGCIDANAHALARYAALCQEAGLVPIVEPEILMTGTHTLEQCQAATERVLPSVFAALRAQRVVLEGIILKPGMVLPGLDNPEQKSAVEIAATTIASLRRVVPASVAGIAFLSGGQTGELACARLNEMTRAARLPWPLTFSFARAIQFPALPIWNGQGGNIALAQEALLRRARRAQAAVRGEYDAELELI